MNRKGDLVQLRSYQDSDLEDLIEVGKDEKIWEYYKLGGWTKSKDLMFIGPEDLERKEKGIHFDFVIIDLESNKIIGYSAISWINQEKKTAMIGSTFIHSDYWGRGHNQEAKRMMIDFAFKELKLEKLKLVCNVLNKRSYHAALKLGFEFVKIQEKVRENTDGTWADFAHFELERK